jgi:hypothetical protein
LNRFTLNINRLRGVVCKTCARTHLAVLRAGALEYALAVLRASALEYAFLLEVVLGIIVGPHALGLVQFDGFVVTMFTFPGGHFKFPHLWPGQIPPGATAGA